ncbi:uncharacterized protein [Antennarius striatus]|uniref:uncharacterized protein n=1 Tax=Antennarius striatus TaxID=241820 RepID=UPI0035AFD62A
MACSMKTALRLLVLLGLLILTEPFEVRDDEWEELRPDIAALHRLKGLPDHMFHEKLQKPSNHRNRSRVQRSTCRSDAEVHPMGLLDDLKHCHRNFSTCVLEMRLDFESFFEGIGELRTEDLLIGASETSHSYNEKFLVMTDDDELTSKRAREEYSADPHYSRIVNRDCLDDPSCLPQAGDYTMVRIFGRVSEDGQTVSGLSGSLLAKLLFKPALKDAAVFSIHGNTSSNFHHRFMRTFLLRGVKVVLEVNTESHQIYQAMDDPNSVSSYQIKKRPIDHSTQYDIQQILIMENDPIVRKAATYLYEKHPSTSSIYTLDENRKPKLIHGDPVPLTEDSRLVLVGHGVKAEETKLAGFTAPEVASIVKDTFRVGDKIKTTSVVACEVGSDKGFVETLLKELHETANIKTKLHVRDSVMQVLHTGQKISQVISTDGTQWQHKDDSRKLVASLDQNGNVVFGTMTDNRGEPIFTNERNTLALKKRIGYRFKIFLKSWPSNPMRFIDQKVFEQLDKTALNELEAMSWGFFHGDLPVPKKLDLNKEKNIDKDYIIRKHLDDEKAVEWMTDNNDKEKVLSDCYEIKSGEDVRNIIRYYAKKGEKNPSYLMVKDWIYVVDPQNLYVHLVGKRLDNNQKENKHAIEDIEKSIKAQFGKSDYPSIRKGIIIDQNRIVESKHEYVNYVTDVLSGEHTVTLPLSTEAWCTTYFTASVICESARNFRTFPLVLMALDVIQSKGQTVSEEDLNFFFDNHPMARGKSWIDPSRRGFTGSATAKGSSKLKNLIPETEEALTEQLQIVLEKEILEYKSWKAQNPENSLENLLRTANNYKIEDKNFISDYTDFKMTLENLGVPKPSGALGGYNDGYTTSNDLTMASNLENSFKLEAQFLRMKSLISKEIYNLFKIHFGERLERLAVQDGSVRMENGEFMCSLVSEGGQPFEVRVKISPETQRYQEKMQNSIETAVHSLETYSPAPSHKPSKVQEHAGTAFGVLGLMLSMKGAVHAFEHGDFKDGVIGALQTTHGVAAMTTAAVATKALTSETRIAKAAATIMRSPAMKGTMAAIPLVGIGFGVYNFAEDLKRGGPLGYIDAVLDGTMIFLDILEIAQPELVPILAPINLALSIVRMVIDDIYMSVENEINSLPKDAGILDKVLAGLRGFGKGLLHFSIQVASFFYDWRYEEIEDGHRLVAQIADYHKYYNVTKEQDGTTAIDFTGGDASWNGGGISFCLAEQGQSELCMDYFVSSDERIDKKCWNIDTQGSQDIILGLGESHDLEYTTLTKKVLMFIPVGSVTVVSGYKAISGSRYGTYKGNSHSNRFFAIQKAEDKHVIEVMLSYYYILYGEPGDDIFFLGPQKSSVQGSGGKDTYIIPANGGKTVINNYDESKAPDLLHFSVKYSQISVSKSVEDLVLMYEGSHTVIIQDWFVGESYRHMSMLSGDGVSFEVSPTVVTSVQLVAKGINLGFRTQGVTVDASQPLLKTVISISGSPFDDILLGNGEKNLMDGGGGRDRLFGGDGGDIYVVKGRQQSSVWIENYSRDNTTDLAMIEADLHSFSVRVQGQDLVLNALHDNTPIHVTLVSWFRSPADRHLLVVTKDLITFAISEEKSDCQQSDPFSKCIKSLRIDYSSSPSGLGLDLEEDEALSSVTEVRGSNFSDVIRGNKEHNVIFPGRGRDFMQGRGGEDWYVISSGQGAKTIDNLSPDLETDFLFLNVQYEDITGTCNGQDILILVKGMTQVYLHKWFLSKNSQHLQVRTSDGVTAGLITDINQCGLFVMLPLIVDYRNQEPQLLHSLPDKVQYLVDYACFRYEITSGEPSCRFKGRLMLMAETDSVKDMYGSSGLDVMMGNSNDNLLDPHTGGALMSGGNGTDTYVIKHGFGDFLIDNFAEDNKVDTVLVDVGFLDWDQITVTTFTQDLVLEITRKEGRQLVVLNKYVLGEQHQHLEFLSSDGVTFRLQPRNSTEPLFDFQAFKVTLKQPEVDCLLDLNAHQRLSKVHTVQGCPEKSNKIQANDEDSVLFGGRKDDMLEGGEGKDTLIGGEGNDILLGNMGDDTLYGEDGNDVMMGNSGQDIFIPGPGADLVDGGPGRDAVLYRGDPDTGKGVYVNLLTGQGRHADAEGDVLKDVEIVVGTIYSDMLVSGYESSLLKGSDGDDALVSTGGDYLVGGDGHDIYMLAFKKGSVTINNCAKDNANDILLLNSKPTLRYKFQFIADGLLLMVLGQDQTALNIELVGWTSDDSECGHLTVVSKGVEGSVGWLLSQCKEGLLL